MSKKSIVKNYFFDMFYRILTIIIPLVTAPYISRVIGAEGIGNYSYTQSICSYFTLFAVLGSNIYGQRQIAFVREEKKKRTGVFWEIMTIRGVCIFISTLAYLFAIINSDGVIKVLFLIQIVDIIGLLFDVTWFVQGLEEFGLIFYRNLIMKGLSVASIFLFVKTEKDLYLYVFLTSLAVIVGNISLWPQLPKYLCKINIKELDVKKHLLPVLSLFLPTIALRVYDVLGKTMLGAIAKDPEENGYYEQAIKIINIVIPVLTSLGNVMSPRMAYLYSQKEKEQLKKYFTLSFEVVIVLALPVAVGLLTVADNFVPWFFGDDFLKVADLLKYFSPICVAMALKNLIGIQYLIPTNRQNLYTLSIVVGLGVSVVLNYLLIPKYTSVGAVVAILVSEYLIVVIQTCMIRKEIEIGELFKRSLSKIFACAVMGIALYSLGNMLSPGIINTIILVACGAAVYGALLILTKDKTIWFVLDKIMAKIKQSS